MVMLMHLVTGDVEQILVICKFLFCIFKAVWFLFNQRFLRYPEIKGEIQEGLHRVLETM